MKQLAQPKKKTNWTGNYRKIEEADNLFLPQVQCEVSTVGDDLERAFL